MTRRKKIYYNAQQRTLIWDRYQQGDSLHDIGKMFDRFHTGVQRIISREGGIRPRQTTRSASHLTPQEREEISRGLSSNKVIRPEKQVRPRAQVQRPLGAG
jgi:hypothetical protein